MKYLTGLWYVLMTSRAVVWLHIQWHHGRPCPKVISALQKAYEEA